MNTIIPLPTLEAGSDADQMSWRAKSLLRALGVLVSQSPNETFPALFLSGWIAEISLKAFLSRNGMNEDHLKNLGHHLEGLWREAAAKGAKLSSDPSPWFEHVSAIHWRRDERGRSVFNGRYASGINGHSCPAPLVLLAEMEKLVAATASS